MLFLIALILAFGFALLCGKPLKKYPFIFYAAAVIITTASVMLVGTDTRSLPEFINTYVIGLFTRGAFATALWYVVMFTGALPNGSAPIKKLMVIRGELSIFTAILTLGHNIGFGQTYFVRFFTDAERMSANQKTAAVLSIAMLVIMIPLAIMSFPSVRKKMNAKLWKKIQRTAYLFYAMIYIHVLVLYYPMAKAGREGVLFNILIYSVAFIGYAVMRIRKHIVIKVKPKNKTILNIISGLVFLGTVSGVFVSCGKDEPKKISDDVSNQSILITTAVSAESSVITTTVQTVSATYTTNTTDTSMETTEISTTEETTETTATETVTETENTEQEISEENPQQEETPEQPEESEIPPETEPSYIYRNGTYSASAYGYDGDVYVDITIENDVITEIHARTEESDDWYFNSAQGSVIAQIISSQNTDVDAYSGATYSSNAIMEAVRKALESAEN
ncbi:MAG: FMN-binding protein [Ruminococcus sp.]|nr:FMN-binding protein [Ruminococcus sp.]